VYVMFVLTLILIPPRAVTFFVVGGLSSSVTPIAMLAGVFMLLLGPPKPDKLKNKDQTK